MEKNNKLMKRRIRELGLRQWQVAEAMGITEWTLSRILRHPLQEHVASRMESAIDELMKEKNNVSEL